LTYGGANTAELRRLFLELEFSRMLDLIEVTAPVTRSYAHVPDRQALEKIAAMARERKVLGFHLVTAGSDPMTAAILGISLSTAAGDGHYLALAHRYLGAPVQLDWGAAMEILAPLFRDPKITKVSHRLKFNEIVLARKGVALAGPIFDTMLAIYLLDPETPQELRELARRILGIEMRVFGEGASKAAKGNQSQFENLPVEEAASFAAAEAEVCVALRAKVEPQIEREGLLPLMRDVELPLSRILAKMEMTGVLVDAKVLDTLAKRVSIELRDLEAKARDIAGRDFSVRSRDQLEAILFDELKLPVLKKTPKGGRSTDAEVLEELAEKHPLPKVICEYREIDKLKGTYIDALPRCIHPETGRIHTRYDQTVAATGRLSSSDPNLQNIPIRTELGREIRAAFIPAPKHVLISADYSQIELRVLAHLSKDAELIAAFSSEDDVHTHTASLVFNVGKKEVTAEMRRRAKTINFGVIYGMGDSALARSLDITRAEAASFIEAYFQRYHGVA
ncbi:MAG: DNA polymerase, partial [Polyangiaceae bacterium]